MRSQRRKNFVPSETFDVGAAQASSADAIVLAERATFRRAAKSVTFYGDAAANATDTYTVHFNEWNKRIQRNLEQCDTVSWKDGGDSTGQTFQQADLPLTFSGEEFGGSITTIRISNYGGAGASCIVRVS